MLDGHPTCALIQADPFPDSLAPVFDAIAETAGEHRLSPADRLAAMHARATQSEGVWIHVAEADALLARLAHLERQRAAGTRLPLLGIPFAVKDNIDVAGMPTTAACPAFSYVPKRSATAVERLTDAGAIVLGKTNLDQFATGLVGTRSPYGIPRNPFDARYIAGGSSSGSAVAVATGMAAFSLGTDTAGSGRVPAAFNNLVGLKPSRGLVSTAGVVPACRSLDCVSIFALTCADAWKIFTIARGFDAADPYSRTAKQLLGTRAPTAIRPFRFGVPAQAERQFFGDRQAEDSFAAAIATLTDLGGSPVEVSLAPFREAAGLLYEGPWIAERLEATHHLLASNPEALDPVVRSILGTAAGYSAADAFRAQARLAHLSRQILPLFEDLATLVVPTAPTLYTIEQVQADPIRLNGNLGTYTNFVNLLDLCAVAVPSGFRPDGLPFGITLIAPAGNEAGLMNLGARYQATACKSLGALAQPWSGPATPEVAPDDPDNVSLAVVGAHLRGEPLNHQLIELGATFVRTTRTAPHYRLFALANTTPPKPGLVRTGPEEEGTAIEVEVWRLSRSAFGGFVTNVPAPLCIGSLELESGLTVYGFLCESYAVASARDISTYGGWRAFRRSLSTTLTSTLAD